MKPFSEHARFEQNNGSDQFYATGSSPSIGDGSFDSALSNKAQIRVSFAVKTNIEMLPNTSSIYYFNPNKNQWSLPANSISDHVGLFDKHSVPTAADDSVNANQGSFITEDQKGFTSTGNPIISGSLDLRRHVETGTDEGNYSDPLVGHLEFGGSYLKNENLDPLPQLIINGLTKEYPKSIQRNADYDSNGMSFELNIDAPFLIEKVVIEVPMTFGPSWFRDKTVSTVIFDTGLIYDYAVTDPIGINTAGYSNFYFDSAGPALTFSLFSEKNYGLTKIRDLITNSTVTNSNDATSNIRVKTIPNTSPPATTEFALSPTLILCESYFSPDTVVSPTNTIGSNEFFTGSIVIKSTPSISNGISKIYLLNSTITDITSAVPDFSPAFMTAAEATIFYRDFFATEYLTKLSIIQSDKNKLRNGESLFLDTINAFGRGMTGFNPSGGSIFGGEYVTNQVVSRKDKSIKNPFFLENAADIEDVINKLIVVVGDRIAYAISQGWITYYLANFLIVAPLDFTSKKNSPYLINPGEKLILAASKTRPAFETVKLKVMDTAPGSPSDPSTGTCLLLSSSTLYDVDYGGPARGHDVCFNTGSINITFYGSYVKEGSEFIP
jgi:hypothetical protein